jgi:hypothetical protein
VWLLPQGLVRRRLTMRESRANGNRRTAPDPLPRMSVESLEPALVTSGHRTNNVLAFWDIAAARLHRGALSDRLAVKMRDGMRHKLLWLSHDPACDTCRATGQRGSSAPTATAPRSRRAC